MAVITQAEVKTILGTTVTTYDTKIAAMIPYVQDDIVEYLGNAFQDEYVSVEGTLTVAVSTGSGDKISDSESRFLRAEFAPGMDIALEGGYSNVGIHTISSTTGAVTAGDIFLTTTGAVIAQDRTDEVNVAGSIKVSRVKWPKALKLPAAKMVWHLIDKPTDPGAVSESLGDYSVTYAGANEYPTSVIKSLEKWRMAKMI